MRDKERLVRRPDEGMIAGVAAGIAERYGIDVTLVRLAFVVLAVITIGWAIIIYFAAAVLMPRGEDEPGVDSVKHGVDDLITRGRELYGETRKVLDRNTTKNGETMAADEEQPVEPAASSPSRPADEPDR
ncbi:MAG: PspC domain-containing protein [Dehalococcoidia bacterium]